MNIPVPQIFILLKQVRKKELTFKGRSAHIVALIEQYFYSTQKKLKRTPK